MRENGLLRKIRGGFADACGIWADEMRNTVRDEGMLIFFILVPLLYPLLYSWIYNNEVVRDVPVVVVDDSHSALGREFVRHCDASPDVRVLCHANDMDEARSLLSRQVVKGIYYLPPDFSVRLGRMEQTAVSVYCDMSLMLTYKAIYQTAMGVALEMNGGFQAKLAGNPTAREDELTISPLDVKPVPIFNPAGGYGSFILPGVLMLILQQTLVLGIGLSAGTARERNRYQDLIPFNRAYQGMFRIVVGKAMCYFMIYAVLGAYLAMVVPRIFDFVVLAEPSALLAVMLPYVLACIFFGMVVSCIVRYRENVMLLVVFASVPLLFLSGVSWPVVLGKLLVALPLHLRHPRIRAGQHHGGVAPRRGFRVSRPVGSGCRLLLPCLRGLPPPDSDVEEARPRTPRPHPPQACPAPFAAPARGQAVV